MILILLLDFFGPQKWLVLVFSVSFNPKTSSIIYDLLVYI